MGRHDYFLIYYNNTNINIDRKSKQIKVWIKMKYTEKGKDNEIQLRKKEGLDINDFQKLDHELLLYLYDYNNMKLKIPSSVHYSLSGDILSSFKSPSVGWDDIVPDSVGDLILKNILETHNIRR